MHLRATHGGAIVRVRIVFGGSAMHSGLSSRAVFCILSTIATSAPAALPEYLSFQLQARSGPVNNFNLPAGASINNASVDLNDAGQVTLRVRVPTGMPGDNFTRHVFVGSNGAGFTVSEGPTTSTISDPRVDASGKVWFTANLDGSGPLAGVYRYDPGNLTTVRITGLPNGTSFYTAPRGVSAGNVGYRVEAASGVAWVSFSAGNLVTLAADRGVNLQSPYSTLFVPSFAENLQLVGKVTLFAGGFDQILSFDSSRAPVVLARSRAEDIQSPYLAFDDAIALSPTSGRVAFIADLNGGARGVYRVDAPGLIVQIARTGLQGLGTIDIFPPAVNDDGLVAFRGVDNTGKPAIYVGDDTTLRRVIGRGDAISSDLGAAQINDVDAGAPVFSGGVAINSNGDIAFSPRLTPAANTTIDWGTGVHIARAGSQLVFANGFE